MTDSADVTAIVLAGGKSSRFGRPKLDERLEGSSLLAHAVGAVGAVAGEVVLALPQGAGSPDLAGLASVVGVRTVHDPEPFGGPLVGLSAALAVTTTPFAIVVGGDMPRLVPAVLAAMLAELEAHDVANGASVPDAVVLAQPGGGRPLPCALRVPVARLATDHALATGERSLRAMLAALRVRELPEASWRALDPSADTLIDIDVPADLEGLKES